MAALSSCRERDWRALRGQWPSCLLRGWKTPWGPCSSNLEAPVREQEPVLGRHPLRGSPPLARLTTGAAVGRVVPRLQLDCTEGGVPAIESCIFESGERLRRTGGVYCELLCCLVWFVNRYTHQVRDPGYLRALALRRNEAARSIFEASVAVLGVLEARPG